MIPIESIIQIGIVVALVLFIYVMIEAIRVLSSFRILLTRVDLLTDLKGWFSFFSKKKKA